MKYAVFAFVVLLPFLFFVVWWWGWAVGYGEAKLEDRKDRSNGGANCGSIGLGRGLTLGQLSVKKKGGVE